MGITGLFSKAAHKCHQRIDLCVIKFIAKRWHIASNTTTVRDRIEDPFVSHIVLPLGIGDIASMIELCLRRFCSPIQAMTLSTVFAIQLFRGWGRSLSSMRRESGRRQKRERNDYRGQAGIYNAHILRYALCRLEATAFRMIQNSVRIE
jgi:hypothetical protein